jgi:hypothetical protein
MASPNLQIEGGNFQDAAGDILVDGYLIWELSHDENYSAGPAQIVAELKFKTPLNSSGSIASSPAVMIYSNDVLTPGGSFYIVMAYKADGTQAWADQQYFTFTSSPNPIDIGTIVPTNPPGSGGSGSSTLLLETNGTINSNQSLLNIAQGTNVTITNVSGTTTINASGGASSPYVLSAGVFDLATGYVNAVPNIGWTDSPNQVNFIKFVMLGGVSGLTHMDTSLGSNLLAGSVFAVGYYNSAGSLIYSSGTQTIGNVNNVTTSYTVPALTLSPGTYYFAWTTQDSGNLTSWGWSGPADLSFHESTAAGNIINQSVIHFGYSSNASTSGPVLPATLGTLNPYQSSPVGSNAFGIPMLFFH